MLIEIDRRDDGEATVARSETSCFGYCTRLGRGGKRSEHRRRNLGTWGEGISRPVERPSAEIRPDRLGLAYCRRDGLDDDRFGGGPPAIVDSTRTILRT